MTCPNSSNLFSSLAACLIHVAALTPAHGAVVTVLGSQYDVTTTSASYSANTAFFDALPVGNMPWWGDLVLASNFASQVFDQLGDGYALGYGPIFAYQFNLTTTPSVYGITQNTSDPNDQLDLDASAPLSPSTTYSYAFATLVSPSSTGAPAPLPLLGAAAAMGWSRRLRRRISQG